MTRPFIIQTIAIAASIGLSFLHPAFLLILIAPLILNIIDLLDIDVSSDSNQIFGSLYILTTKRVHTEYGRFFIFIRKDRIYLYQDKFFYLKYIDRNHFINVDNLKEWIKKECDSITREEKEQNELRKNVKDWNGCVDIQSERNKKLEKLIN